MLRAQVGDLSIEYKIKPVKDYSGIYYQSHESLFGPVTFNTSPTDNFNTSHNGMVSDEMKREMVCVFDFHLCFLVCFLSFFFLFFVSTGHLKTHLLCKIKGARVVLQLTNVWL